MILEIKLKIQFIWEKEHTENIEQNAFKIKNKEILMKESAKE